MALHCGARTRRHRRRSLRIHHHLHRCGIRRRFAIGKAESCQSISESGKFTAPKDSSRSKIQTVQLSTAVREDLRSITDEGHELSAELHREFRGPNLLTIHSRNGSDAALEAEKENVFGVHGGRVSGVGAICNHEADEATCEIRETVARKITVRIDAEAAKTEYQIIRSGWSVSKFTDSLPLLDSCTKKQRRQILQNDFGKIEGIMRGIG
jgi:hypothetical protein